jgi:hypothetical protein
MQQSVIPGQLQSDKHRVSPRLSVESVREQPPTPVSFSRLNKLNG